MRIAAKQPQLTGQRENLAVLSGVEFDNGTIDIELAGTRLASAGGMARGFIGVAFHVRIVVTDHQSLDASEGSGHFMFV